MDSIISLTSAGAETLVSGDAVLLNASAAKAGDYTITGDGTATIGITVTADASPPTGLSLESFDAKYNGGAIASSGLTAPTSSGKHLLVGANLKVTSAAAEGVPTVPYTITVSYQ